ncbi:hypothetical protein K469DRAFT_280311 [Zopfia rhizophila CBS 207.26]|uniref:Uncharacterized protein n=1 Tax=Zopfia rhizophila CBS 207.26 TaxID=1314779 RepID=A0A6A6EQC7_9PEZI|nr:hypothetical protein K469DRAFT_280311 [Zopfia rhizophila CBS 207.26]
MRNDTVRICTDRLRHIMYLLITVGGPHTRLAFLRILLRVRESTVRFYRFSRTAVNQTIGRCL